MGNHTGKNDQAVPLSLSRRSVLRGAILGTALVAPAAIGLVSIGTAQAAPAARFASRVHGLVVLAQDGAYGERVGNQVAFNLQASTTPYWFHIPISTPAVVDAQQMSLLRIWLNFATPNVPSQLTEVTTVHVYDGRDFIQPFPGVLAGDQRAAQFDLATPHPIHWGLSISVAVQAYKDLSGIIFYGAGADFDTIGG